VGAAPIEKITIIDPHLELPTLSIHGVAEADLKASGTKQRLVRRALDTPTSRLFHDRKQPLVIPSAVHRKPLVILSAVRRKHGRDDVATSMALNSDP